MTNRRLRPILALAVPLTAAALLLGGCTSSDGTTIKPQAGGSDTSTTSRPDTRPTSPGTTPPPWTGTPQQIAGARLVFFDILPVPAADYPGPDVPQAVKLDGLSDLATTYAAMPGIQAVLDAVRADPPTADETLYAFVVNPCIVDSAILTATDTTVSVKLTGTGSASVKCEPPPIRMAVFSVTSTSIPASAAAAPVTY